MYDELILRTEHDLEATIRIELVQLRDLYVHDTYLEIDYGMRFSIRFQGALLKLLHPGQTWLRIISDASAYNPCLLSISLHNPPDKVWTPFWPHFQEAIFEDTA